jgi:dihydrofolate reductase
MSVGTGRVVVNRCMSLDGFIAAAGHVMDWGHGRQLHDFVGPDAVHEVAAATGAMLIGRRTSDVGDRMAAEKPGSVDYPFSGPMFVLTHRPPERPAPGITYLSGDIGDAVATARSAAGGKDVEVLGADVAAQCLERGLVDELLVYVLPLLLGDGIRFSPPSLPLIDLEPVSSTRSGTATMLRFRVCNEKILATAAG